MGTANFGLVWINLGETERFFNQRINNLNLNSDYLKNLSETELIEFVEVNELAHLILHIIYNFVPNNDKDWSDISSGIPDFKIDSSQAVHEFFSDAASINSSRIGLLMMIGDLLIQKSKGKGVRSAYNYPIEYLNNWLENKIPDLFNESVARIKDIRSKNVAGKELSSAFNLEIIKIISVLSQDDYIDMQNAYANQARLLLKEIEKMRENQQGAV